MSCWILHCTSYPPFDFVSALPNDLKKEVARYLHKKYFDVVLDELLLVTEYVSFYEHNRYATKITLISFGNSYNIRSRWIWSVPYSDDPIRNILFERKRCSGKMASLP